jgi:hypothetical protein
MARGLDLVDWWEETAQQGNKHLKEVFAQTDDSILGKLGKD